MSVTPDTEIAVPAGPSRSTLKTVNAPLFVLATVNAEPSAAGEMPL